MTKIPKAEWHIYQERFPNSDELDSWTITNNPNIEGWDTDSGYDGYGLPKELAQWICDILNESNKKCAWARQRGVWKKNEKQS